MLSSTNRRRRRIYARPRSARTRMHFLPGVRLSVVKKTRDLNPVQLVFPACEHAQFSAQLHLNNPNRFSYGARGLAVPGDTVPALGAGSDSPNERPTRPLPLKG